MKRNSQLDDTRVEARFGTTRARYLIEDTPLPQAGASYECTLSPVYRWADVRRFDARWRDDSRILCPAPAIAGPPWLVLNEARDERFPLPGDDSTERFDILTMRSLHEDLSAVPLKQKSVLAFAQGHGFLGRRTLPLVYDWPFGEFDSTYTWGEPLSDWYHAIAKLRTLLHLWRLTSNWSEKTAPQLVDFLSSDSASTDRDASAAENAISQHLWLVLALSDYGESDKPYRLLRQRTVDIVQRMVNEEIAEGTVASFQFSDAGQVVPVPKDPLGAAYVQFAWEIGGKPDKRCKGPGCWSFFESKDPRRIYCGDECKLRAYRERERIKKVNGN